MDYTKEVWSIPITALDWPEDFSGENGRYMNLCTTCNLHFQGHKRRVTCKVCSTKETAPKITTLPERHILLCCSMLNYCAFCKKLGDKTLLEVRTNLEFFFDKGIIEEALNRVSGYHHPIDDEL